MFFKSAALRAPLIAPSADVFQIGGAEGAFDRALGTHIHKDRRLYCAVGTGELAPTGSAVFLFYLKQRRSYFLSQISLAMNMASPKEKKRYRSFTASA